MNILGKCCLLALLLTSNLTFAEELMIKKDVCTKEVCPDGQIFDQEKGVCVDKVVVPVEHEKVEAPLSE